MSRPADAGKALELVERVIKGRPAALGPLRHDPALDALRALPRFGALLEQLPTSIPSRVREYGPVFAEAFTGGAMARALWKGTLSFGLVNIPVELHTAVRENRPSFRLLRASDKSRIRFQRVAEKDDEVVEWDDIVKGYEYEKGRYIVLTREDLAAAAAKKDRMIQVVDFVTSQDIDDRYFEKPYYLLPAQGAARAYALFREAMGRAQRTGIARFVLRDKEQLAAIETIGEAIVLTTLRFRDELVKLEEYDFPPARGVSERDLKLAGRLIEEFSGTWDPDQYTDEYRKHIMQVINAKRKKQEPRIRIAEEKHSAQVVDLMERLRQSLGSARDGRRTTKGAKRTRAAKPKGPGRARRSRAA